MKCIHGIEYPKPCFGCAWELFVIDTQRLFEMIGRTIE